MFFLSQKGFSSDPWPFHSWKDYAIGIVGNFILISVVVFGCLLDEKYGNSAKIINKGTPDVPRKVVWIVPAPADAPEYVEGVVAEAPIPLGGGICLVGVSFNDFHDGRDVRAVLVSADRPLVVGQEVKVKIRLISETHRAVSDLLVIQDEIPK